MSLILALALAQIGPLVTPGAAPPMQHERPTEVLRPPRNKGKQPTPQAQASPVRPCPDTGNAGDAREAASKWLETAKGREAANAGECLGVALSRQGEWSEAAATFRVAQGQADTPVWRARLSAMAGEAALNANDFTGALASLDAARIDAGEDAVTRAGLAVFRARALVGLKREGEAEAALTEARAAAPQDAETWLLSATLSRRLGKLAEAQAQIEKAAELKPVDPEIGLEAGLIAVLGGHDAAARKSWESVIAAAPDSPSAATAKSYIAQLAPVAGPAPGPKQKAKP